jgi:hypothetical protein
MATSNYPCVINFLCVIAKEPFSIPGCGCGCCAINTTQPAMNITAPTNVTTPVNTTTPSSNTTCPTGPDCSYAQQSYPCVINFFCVIGKEPFSIPGCGCGCRTINTAQPLFNITAPTNVTTPVNSTTPSSNVTCPAGADYR